MAAEVTAAVVALVVAAAVAVAAVIEAGGEEAVHPLAGATDRAAGAPHTPAAAEGPTAVAAQPGVRVNNPGEIFRSNPAARAADRAAT